MIERNEEKCGGRMRVPMVGRLSPYSAGTTAKHTHSVCLVQCMCAERDSHKNGTYLRVICREIFYSKAKTKGKKTFFFLFLP